MLSLASELEATGSLRRSANPRLLLEMLLLRLSYLDRTVELEELLRGLGGAPLGDPPGPPAKTPAAEPARRSGPAARKPQEPAPPQAPPQTTPEPAVAAAEPETPSEPRDLHEVWERAVDGVGGLPPGSVAFLRGGEAAREGDRVVVTVQDTVLERLLPEHLTALQSSLAGVLGGSCTLEVRGTTPGASAEARISQETVRQGRLRELIREEPALEHAVRELDLELLD